MPVGFTVRVFEEVRNKLGGPLMFTLSQATDAEIQEKASFMFNRKSGMQRWVLNIDGNWDVYLSKLPQPKEGISWVVDKITSHGDNAFWRYTDSDKRMLKVVAPYMDEDRLGEAVQVDNNGRPVLLDLTGI
jgi:hypothetical protein